MPPISRLWTGSPRLLAEDLVAVPEPLALALEPGDESAPAAVASRAARALLDLPEMAPQPPRWLAAHQVPALNRLRAILGRYGGALLADAVGLGKSYVAIAVALECRDPISLVVPAVLVAQWKRLLQEKQVDGAIITHESLSRPGPGLAPGVSTPGRLVVVDEAHRFRNPDTLRYRRLAELCVGARVLLVTATPVHNRLADLFHLFRLFLRDDALTGLGLGSLIRASRGECDAAVLEAVAPRLIVARSRARVGPVLHFPRRSAGETARVGTASPQTIIALVERITTLEISGRAAALMRLVLLRRLASSLPAFRATLSRFRAFLDVAAEARLSGGRLDASDFQRLFPRGESADLQLTLLPLLLEPGNSSTTSTNLQTLDNLHQLSSDNADPKAEALDRLLATHRGKSIVFTDARETARYLHRRLGRSHRVAVVTGASGWFGDARAPTHEVLASFAPLAQGAAAPPRALATDVLIATDLASEGLNLQDAVQVIHYDLPWSPARLAQRVGRIDRLGSKHDVVATFTFLPPRELARALGFERRLMAKVLDQLRAGTAQTETAAGDAPHTAPLDWCDRLQTLLGTDAPAGAWACVAGDRDVVVLVVRVGEHAEVIVVEGGVAKAAPEQATELLESVAALPAVGERRATLDAAIRAAAPLVRARIAALQSARWRAEDRDRLARRLIPFVLTAARKVARSGDADFLRRLDQLVNRLTLGMTAGEEFTLRALVERRASLAVRDLLAWHERLPPVATSSSSPTVALVGALVFHAS